MSVNLTSLKKISSVILCKMNKTMIGEIPLDFIDSETRSLNEVDEIRLTIPRYITDRTTKEKKEYILYKEFRNKRYLFIDESEYFIIESIKENKRKTEKVVTAYSGEYKLNKLNISIEDAYIQLMSEDLSNVNYPIYSINNELQKATSWSFDTIEDSVLYEDVDTQVEKLRGIESVDKDWYSFITEDIAELFNCMPFFDTVNKKIDLVSLESFGEIIQLCLTYDNYINDLAIESDSKELVTRLTLINDNLDIAGNTCTGYNHINNFSYFIKIREMSDELISALAKYEEMITIRNAEWKTLREDKVNKQSELALKRNEWLICNSKLNVLINQINLFKTKDDEVNMVLKQEEYTTVADEEALLRIEIRTLEEQIELLDASIANINELCKYETCTDENGQLVFTAELLEELKEFIFEDSFKEENYLIEEDMIKAGERKLELACMPTIEYEIDVVNFLNRIIDNGFRQHWNGTLSFGDIISLIDDDDNEELVYFTGYEYDYKNNGLSLTLANKKVYGDQVRTINDRLKTAKQLNKIMQQNGYVFNKTKNYRLNMETRDIQ